jgi:hypothetical protein
MVLSMREFMFRASIDAAAYPDRALLDEATGPTRANEYASQSANWTQRIPYNCSAEHVVYRTSGAYVAAGAIASLLGVLAVLPLYHGWWRLSRKVSLSPLEVAKAFGASLLGDVGSNADAEELASSVG